MSQVKEIKLANHGNYIYGTLDAIDFVESGVIEDKNVKYSGSIKLKFIMKSTHMKKIGDKEIPTVRANSQIIKIQVKDEEIEALVLKYNELIGKDLLISYGGKDGDTFTIQDEKDVLTIK